MKSNLKNISSIIILILATTSLHRSYGQVGINTTTPGASSMLDITSTNKGLLIPRMTSIQRLAIPSPANGLMVYDITTNQFYYFNGTVWMPFVSGNSGWNLTGNAGTIDGTNYIGTTDNVPFNIRVNNQKAGRIDNSNRVVALGYMAANSLVAGGTDNVYLGDSSGFLATTADRNTFVGSRTGHKTIASDNSFFGSQTGFNTTNGGNNSFFGVQSGLSNTSGNGNSFFGSVSGQSNTTGFSNCFFGIQSGLSNTNGNNNSFYGTATGHNNLSGFSNSFFGNQSGFNNTTGANNVAIGDSAAYNNQTLSHIVAIGSHALYSNTGGSNLTALGDSALFSNTIGEYNTAQGSEALRKNTIGNRNSANGAFALYSNITGSFNTATGTSALYANTSGHFNVAYGSEALILNTTGIQNVADGVYSLFNNSTGNQNTAVGHGALILNSSGNLNVALGYSSLNNNITGSNNTCLGAESQVGAVFSNATAVGSKALVSSSNSLILGSINGINGATASVNVGIGTTTPLAKLHVVGLGGSTGVSPQVDAGIVLDETGDDVYLNILSDINKTGGILFGNTSNNADGGILYNNTGQRDLRFRTNGNVNRMVIDPSGSVGIATMAPAAKLDVEGNVKIGINGTPFNEIIRFNFSFDLPSIAANGTTTLISFAVPTAAVGSTVFVSPEIAMPLGFVVAYACVSSPGIVTMRFTNASGIAIDPPLTNFYVTLIR